MSRERQHVSGTPGECAARRESAKQAVSGLFSDWYGPLVRYACRAAGSLETAEDVVQAAFTELYRALLQGASIGNPKGWTLCVVRREIVDRLREQQRHGGAFLPLSEAERLGGGSVMADFAEADLTRLLAGLSAREEEVVLLRAQALKYRQIAAELKIGINSVKTLLARAIRKMQQASAAPQQERKGSKRDGDTIPAALQ